MELPGVGGASLKVVSCNNSAIGLNDPIPLKIQKLIEKLKSDKINVREKAIRSLGLMGEDARTAIFALSETLSKDIDPYIRAIAAWALGYIGSEKAGPPLAEACLRDKNEYVRWAAVEALGRSGIDKRTIVSVLTEALSDENKYVRGEANNILSTIQQRLKTTL